MYDRRFSLIPKNVDRVVKATVVLHNLRGKKGLNEIVELLNPDHNPIMGHHRALQPMGRLGYHSKAECMPSEAECMQLCDIIKGFFVWLEGAVPWQDRMVPL